MNIQKKKEAFGIRLLKNIRKHWILYLMVTPVVLYYIIFSYVPMYGVLLAFKEYEIKKGILGSSWVGFEHFRRFFSAYDFERLLMNTIGLSVYGMIAGFPIPIIFALMLNYLRHTKLKKVVQMVSYAPYFISTVVICGMITIFMSQDSSIFNVIRGFFGLEPVNFLAKAEWFKHIYVWSGVWQGMGWSSIIYISALAAEARLSRPAVRMAHARAEGAVAHHPINCLKSRFHGIVSRITDVPFYCDYHIMLFGFSQVFIKNVPLQGRYSSTRLPRGT